MKTFSVLLALCARNSPVTGEFPAQRPVTRSFYVFFDLRLDKRLGKQWWGWWFETPARQLWSHCNGMFADPLNSIGPTLSKYHFVTRHLRSNTALLEWITPSSYGMICFCRSKFCFPRGSMSRVNLILVSLVCKNASCRKTSTYYSTHDNSLSVSAVSRSSSLFVGKTDPPIHLGIAIAPGRNMLICCYIGVVCYFDFRNCLFLKDKYREVVKQWSVVTRSA